MAMTETTAEIMTASKGKGPGGRHENMRTYTPTESALVMRLVEEHAPRWTHIAQLVSEATHQPRTAASIRNYYKRFNASKAIAEKESAIRKLNRCQMCGQIKRGHICKPATVLPSVSEEPAAVAVAVATGVESPPPSAAPEPPLALSSKDDLPPLAPASLEVLFTPGTSPLSTLSTSGPLSIGGLSMLGSPLASLVHGLQNGSSGGAAHFPFAFARPLPVAEIPAEDGAPAAEDEELTDAGGEQLAPSLEGAPVQAASA